MSKYAVNIVLFFSILCLIPLRHLKFDFEMEALFPSGDADVKFYEQFQNQFQTQSEGELIFIALENKGGIFQQDFLKKADEVTQYISKLEHVHKVYSITNANILFFRDSQVGARPLIHIQSPERYPDDSVYLFNSPEYRDLLVSINSKSIAIAAFIEEEATRSDKNLITEAIRKKARSLEFYRFHFVSKTVAEKDIYKEINKELKIFALAFLLVFPFIGFLFFRSLRFGFFLLVVVAISTVWTFTIMLLFGYSPDMFSIFIPFILLVATISGFVQSSANYGGLKSSVHTLKTLRQTRVQRAVLTIAVFVSAAFSLIFSNVASIRSFGIFSGIGLILNYALTTIFLESNLVNPISKNDKIGDDRFLTIFFKAGIKYKRLLFSFFILLFVVCLYFLSGIGFASRVADRLAEHSAIKEDYQFIEDNFSGVLPIEMKLTVHNDRHSFLEVDLMREVEEIEKYLRDSCGIGDLISPLSLFKGANKAFNGGEISFYKLPEPNDVQRLYSAIMQTEHADEMRHYFLSDASSMRISGRTADLSLRSLNKKSNRFHEFFIRRGYAHSFSYQITGPIILLNKSLGQLSRTLEIEFLIGFLTLALSIFYLTRKITFVLITLISGGLPLIFMAGAIGFLNIDLGLESLILFLIAFGITSANSINIFFCKSRDGEANSNHESIKKERVKSARILIRSNCLLLFPILLLLNSGFAIVFQFGLFLCVLLLGSLLTNLCLILFLKKTSVH
jgi:predicted RND superfamily exporter protein